MPCVSLRTLVPLVLSVLLTVTARAEPIYPSAPPLKKGYAFNIAHMANTPAGVDWAVANGANGVEIDLRFDEEELYFMHGGISDCACNYESNHICSNGSGGNARTNAATHLQHIASHNDSVTLVIIDSKIDEFAGSWSKIDKKVLSLVPLLDKQLFSQGYRGQVIISAPKFQHEPYLQKLAKVVTQSKYAEKIYFTFDGEGHNYERAVYNLSNITSNRVYGTGVTACLPGNFQAEMRKSKAAEDAGENALTYIWTLDNGRSMAEYLDQGARGIITNKPGILRQVLLEKELQLAQPDPVPVTKFSAKKPSPKASSSR